MTAGSSYASNENKNHVNIKNEWKERTELNKEFALYKQTASSLLSRREKEKARKIHAKCSSLPSRRVSFEFSRVGEYFARSSVTRKIIETTRSLKKRVSVHSANVIRSSNSMFRQPWRTNKSS